MQLMRTLLAVLAVSMSFATAGCETTSTADGYKPANCAMVGSSCGRSGWPR